MFKLIGLATAAVGGLVAYASTRADRFRVERSIRIDAPPEAIFPLIEDFRAWSAWSPYEDLDPDMKRIFSGEPSGVGAAYAWEGNLKAGTGRMRITEVSAPSKVVIALDFTRPFEASNVAELTLTPAGGSTEVTWAMSGQSKLLSKVMGVFFDMDKLVGTAFETGLAKLKGVVETRIATSAMS